MRHADPEFGIDRAEGDRILAQLVAEHRPRAPRRREPGPRYPLAPLRAQRSLSELSRAVGIERGTLHRWERTGGVDEFVADELAVAVGAHPAEIWPEWW